ncbi:MAG: hypothetical protein AAGI30_07735 [Planctomycetota bacterium]
MKTPVPRPILLIALSGSLVAAAMAASDAYVVDVDALEPGQILGMAANVTEPDSDDLDGWPDVRPVLPAETELGDEQITALRDAGVKRVRVTDFQWSQWKWKWAFLAGCAGMLASGLMLRAGAKQAAAAAATPDGADAAGPEPAAAAVTLLASDASQLRAETAGRSDDESRHRIIEAIDAIRRGPLADVHRTMDGLKQHARGYTHYAEVIIPLSAGERALHRSWSSAVDGDAAEARTALDRAVEMLEEASNAAGE